jgi:hypothetical protein
LGEDCNGRPCEWVDERLLIIERFARLHSIAIIDTETAAQCDLLAHSDQSIKNPRLSPDRHWLAFDATRPGEPSSVMVARLRIDSLIPESEWILVDRAASHPFWSADGHLLYYLPTGANPMIRSLVRARRFEPQRGPGGEPIAVYASSEMVMAAFLPGPTPIATPEQIVLVLGDFRGDVWIMELAAAGDR